MENEKIDITLHCIYNYAQYEMVGVYAVVGVVVIANNYTGTYSAIRVISYNKKRI